MNQGQPKKHSLPGTSNPFVPGMRKRARLFTFSALLIKLHDQSVISVDTGTGDYAAMHLFEAGWFSLVT